MTKVKLKGGATFGLQSVVSRLLFSCFLIFATYNPSGRSYWHWLMADGAIGPRLIVGLVLVGSYVVLLIATWEVIGFSGMFLVALICLSGAWELHKLAVIDLRDGGTFALAVCVTASIVLAFGMSFAFIYSRMTGIIHTRGSTH